MHFKISGKYMALYHLKFIYLLSLFMNLKNMLVRSCSGALLTQTFFLRDGALDLLCTFANNHACVTCSIHSGTSTENSKPDSPSQPTCLKSDTGASKCTAVHSFGIVVLNKLTRCATKLNLCLLRRHVHTTVIWSPWLPFMISYFS